MNCRTSFSQRLAGCIVTLIVGSVGVTAANPVMSQPKTLRFQMAQSSAITGSWRLANMAETTAPTPTVPLQATELTADFSDERISGSGGCNRFMGSYTTKGEQLSISSLASTFKACEESVMKQEFR